MNLRNKVNKINMLYKNNKYQAAKNEILNLVDVTDSKYITALLLSEAFKNLNTDYNKSICTICDIVYNTLSHGDLNELKYFKIKLKCENVYVSLVSSYIMSLMFGKLAFIEQNVNNKIDSDEITISNKVEIYCALRKIIYEIKMKIKPDYYKNMSKELIGSLFLSTLECERFRVGKLESVKSLFRREFVNNVIPLSRGSKRIIVLVDEIISGSHSTVTKLIFDWIYCVGEFYPEYSVEVLVTLDFLIDGTDAVGTNKQPEINLLKMLDDLNLSSEYTRKISILYRKNGEDLMAWLKKHLNNKPILSLFCFPSPKWSLPIMLNDLYPIVGVELANGMNLNGMASVIIPNGTINEKTIKIYGDKLFKAEFPKIPFLPKEKYKRSDFNIPTNSVLIVSVGRSFVMRSINTEWNEYVDNITTLLKQNNNHVWLFVGESLENFTKSVNEELAVYINDRIFIIENERDLMALYNICDIFAMPPINGGGRGLTLAAFSKLACICLSKSDGSKNIPNDFVFDTLSDYFNFVKLLIDDIELRVFASNKCFDKVSEHGLLLKSATDFINACKQANNLFIK
jgi:glycosyltransferase involved in cell wall biosynthesis